MFATIVVLMLASCSKKDAVMADTVSQLREDTSYSDQTLASPKTRLLIGKMSYRAGADNDGIRKLTPSFILADMSLSSVRNFYCRITREGDSSNAVFTMPRANPVLDGTITNNDGAFASIRNGTYTIWWYADIAGISTGSLSIKTSIEYLTTGGTKTLGFTSGQTITFATAKMVSLVSATTPLSQKVQADAEHRTISVDLAASGGTVTVQSLQVRIHDASTVQELRVYEGSTTIGSVALQATGTTTRTIPIALTIQDGQTKTISCGQLLRQITASQHSQTNIKTTVLSVTYSNEFGETKTTDTPCEGNDIYAYRSVLTAQSIPQATLGLVNTVRRNMATLRVTPQGDGSISQVAYAVNFLNSFGNTSQTLDNLECWINGVNVTSMVVFSTKQHARIDSVSAQMLSPAAGDSLLFMKYIGGSGEYPVSSVVTIELYATPRNFQWGNAVEFGVVYDSGVPRSGTYLVASAANQFVVTLSSNRTVPGSIPAIIWSDKSAGPQHTAVPGGNSGDWFSMLVGSHQTFYAN